MLTALARWFVRGLVRFYYPRILIQHPERIPATGPVLLIANHPNSLIDPVLLGIAARRPVRLLAKATLFDVPLFGRILHAAGMIPVHRGADDPRAVKNNLEILASAGRALATSGGALGLFPEGKTHDALRLATVKSGAARLALAAHEAGAVGLRIIPVALNYERKEKFRSSIWIRLGEPLDVAAFLATHGGDTHVAQRALTPELDRRLRTELIDLDDPAWEPLLDHLPALLPPATRAPHLLPALALRKTLADALNHFHRTAPERSRADAARVSAHADNLAKIGLTPEARLLHQRGPALFLRLGRDAFGAWLGSGFALWGLALHLIPFTLSRIVARLLGRGDRATLALWRLFFGALLLLATYTVFALAAAAYFQPWVVILLAATAPAAGLYGVHWLRIQRSRARAWWAELGLLRDRDRASALRAEHTAIGQLLASYATAWTAQLPTPSTPSAVAPTLNLTPPELSLAAPARATAALLLRPPAWVSAVLLTVFLAATLGGGFWLWHDHPLEWRRTDSPALHQFEPARLGAELDRDERALTAVLTGIDELDTKFHAFEAELNAGQRSYYNPADDDEIRRLLTTFLALREATLRTAWAYERHGQLNPGPARTRAARLHGTALITSYDLALRFTLAFRASPEAQRKLNEAEPRWNLPPDTYDTLRATLAHRTYRRLVKRAVDYARNPSDEALAPPLPAAFASAVTAASARILKADTFWLREKIITRADDIRDLADAGFYRASARVSMLVGDARLRAPRQGQALIHPSQFRELHGKLQPGDILIERRNWYLSNAFLPGYWPHAALYVGTAEELRALGLADDPRVAPKLAAFATPDAQGHAHAVIEAMSEGVVFTSAEHSIGEADGVAVFRPRVDAAARREIIARAFDHAGKPYDFDFDFFSADKLVCTEVVYRATAGYVELPLVEVLGRKTLPALEIVRQSFTPQGQAQLEFIAMLDGDETSGTATWADAATLRATLDRPALTWLQPKATRK